MRPITENINNTTRGSDPVLLTHIIPAVISLLILVGAIVYYDKYASSYENGYVRALAPILMSQDVNGLVIQQAAFRQPDLLPVYGSSEMVNVANIYRSFYFFANYPTGFQIFDVAKSGNSALNIAQDIASLGTELRGKKVVISFTPSIYNFSEVQDNAYAANFSRMHANGLIFNPDISVAVRRLAAKRMLEYPDTYANDPVLTYALQNLAEGAFYNILMYDLIYPLGRLGNLTIRLQDHFAIWEFIQGRPNLKKTVKRIPREVNWNVVVANADALQRSIVYKKIARSNNPGWYQNFGIPVRKKPGSDDKNYIAKLERSKEWGDMTILLEILKELGAKPLIMSRPINGDMYIASGISPQAQQVYYTRLETLAKTYSMPLVDFHEYTNDPYFSVDMASHTSPKGWAVVDKTLDDFYHGRIGQ